MSYILNHESKINNTEMYIGNFSIEIKGLKAKQESFTQDTNTLFYELSELKQRITSFENPLSQ